LTGTTPPRFVVLTDNSVHPETVERLRARAEVRVLDAYPSESTLAEAYRQADAILARLGVVTAGVVGACLRVRIIARHGAGSVGVDLAAATARGIVVTTTGPANAGAVAEYTFALPLGLLRKVPAADAGMQVCLRRRCPDCRYSTCCRDATRCHCIYGWRTTTPASSMRRRSLR
jgi:phosphoglycerate dehydrogenase-like enzyme